MVKHTGTLSKVGIATLIKCILMILFMNPSINTQHSWLVFVILLLLLVVLGNIRSLKKASLILVASIIVLTIILIVSAVSFLNEFIHNLSLINILLNFFFIIYGIHLLYLALAYEEFVRNSIRGLLTLVGISYVIFSLLDLRCLEMSHDPRIFSLALEALYALIILRKA